jgi:hypothetical protein
VTHTEPLLRHALEQLRLRHAERAASPALAAALDDLADFQSRRLAATYRDLALDPRYRDAVAFFGAEIYGPGDFSRRDADLARVVPAMRRLLPSGVIETVVTAMQMSLLAMELDRALLDKLGEQSLTVASYCAAYRGCANRDARVRQIALIGVVGRGLDHYVHTPLLRQALAVMRMPARAAGLAVLQGFLERGAGAFARMRGAAHFLATIDLRETALMNTILGGDDAPFPDPRGTTS